MKLITYDISQSRVKSLMATDSSLNRLIKHIKTATISIEPDGFKCIVKYIIGQQISDKARETIWQRLCSIYSNFTPVLAQSLSDDNLRSIGLSYRKITYIKSLAKAIVDNEINFEKFNIMSNEEIIKQLTSIKGIGKWTAEMYLIFSLGRENVLAKDDGTIQRVIKWIYNLDSLPNHKQLTNYFSKCQENETIVSAYFWKAIELNLLQNSFDENI